ncbi:hypothetical protein [Amantichitinum ursilacus]|uniref:Uncharacterized protein n=1 Tax=Amantichitinum ursilacus TaxID=857265 RepID=A0A0N0GNB3_9NEIS|nr:hypothetical protein [Amantichitinum ursilacus]KPC52545.1 hypothetical protein WG78_11895 [Amantichitinum ursilacus]
MSLDKQALLSKRKENFPNFFDELLTALVDFVGKLGIRPAHEVLKNAVQFGPYVDDALRDMEIKSEEDKIWVLQRIGYFIGEYFVQKFGGAWYINEITGSRYFARYVVGQFAGFGGTTMLDPFDVAHVYVNSPAPRHLISLLAEVEKELNETLSNGKP